MQRTNIFLEERQTDALDAMARLEGVSRAEVIRRIIDRAIDGEGNAEARRRAAIDLSFGAAARIAVERGADDARAAQLASMWGRDA